MIHVVTPFSRTENVAVLHGHLAGQGVIWHPLVSLVPWPAGYDDEWIQPFTVFVPEGADPFCTKLNAFSRSGLIVDGDKYAILNDDDMYDEGTLAEVDAMDARIVIVSMLRGQRTPGFVANGHYHPPTTLVASPDYLHIGGIGCEQYFVAGELFRQMDFDVNRPCCCDGVAAEWLRDNYGSEIAYRPDLYVLFNRLEPGRWAVDYESTRLLPA